jgi:hypothetical protein
MRSSNLTRFFFVLYCLEAGTLLLFLPWSPTWDRAMMNLSFPTLRLLLLHPFLRGGLSGLGLVHLVWGAHDLQALVMGWKPRHPADRSDGAGYGRSDPADPDSGAAP